MLIAFNDRHSAVRILSECGQHVAIPTELKNRSEHLLSELSDQLPSDVFVRLKDRSQLPDINTVAAKWRHQLQYAVPSDDDEPLLEQLTRTERRVLMLMDSELSYPEIAELQHVSINTIKTHRKNIYTKLGVNTREEAVDRAKNLRLF
jgi:ATP/maltotriose-dependent transcriptional regulator MalT